MSAGAHIVEFTNTTSGAGIDALEVIASVGVGIYDDDDSAWTFTGNWRTYSYIGYYEGEQHYGLALGDYATFVFEGQQFELIYTAAAVRGDVQVYLEDIYLETIHQYSATFAAQRKWSGPLLSPGAHVVKFVNATEGSSISIDAIRVIVFAGAGVYDDSDASWSFTGTWSIPTYGEYYGGEQHITTMLNDFATFAFEGSGFELIYTAASMRGEVQVYIDGAPSGNIDQYDELFAAQEGWASPPLTRGRHVVKLVNAIPGQSISIDAIAIEP